MIIGAVKEKKKFENRVSISPEDVKNYVKAGHQVFIEKGAGSLSGFHDKLYKESGASLSTSKEVFKNSDIILKINCPSPDESKLIKNNLILSKNIAGMVDIFTASIAFFLRDLYGALSVIESVPPPPPPRPGNFGSLLISS